MGFKLNYSKDIYNENPRVEEIPFDSDRKLMTTVHEVNGKYIVYTKGGVDELLACCKGYNLNGEVKHDLSNFAVSIRKHNEEMAKDANPIRNDYDAHIISDNNGICGGRRFVSGCG